VDSTITDITHVIQLAVAPVFLLTAIATLINAMNTRLSRIVDRRRVVLGRLGGTDGHVQEEVDEELAQLERRSRLIYYAIFSAVLSALLVCLVVVAAFVGALLTEPLAKLVASLFILAMLSMILGLSLFLREIYFAVSAGTHTRR
jgi:uncharacterized membrane protein (DUF485 family)